jgi:hypothetical protein
VGGWVVCVLATEIASRGGPLFKDGESAAPRHASAEINPFVAMKRSLSWARPAAAHATLAATQLALLYLLICAKVIHFFATRGICARTRTREICLRPAYLNSIWNHALHFTWLNVSLHVRPVLWRD